MLISSENGERNPNKELMALLPDLNVDMANPVNAQKAFDNLLTDISDQMNPTAARRLGFLMSKLQICIKQRQHSGH